MEVFGTYFFKFNYFNILSGRGKVGAGMKKGRSNDRPFSCLVAREGLEPPTLRI